MATSTAEKLRQLSRCVLGRLAATVLKRTVARDVGVVHGSLAAWYGALPGMARSRTHPAGTAQCAHCAHRRHRSRGCCRASYLLGLARGRGLLQQDTVDQEHPTRAEPNGLRLCSIKHDASTQSCLLEHARPSLPACTQMDTSHAYTRSLACGGQSEAPFMHYPDDRC